MRDGDEIPLFALGTVLFPDGLLPLRVFETRYLDMIGECLRDRKGFGVCAIESGHEVGSAASCYGVGTLAVIQDFDRGADGVLSILARGERRFRILRTRVEPSQLLRASVAWLDEPQDVPLPPPHRAMASFLAQLLQRAGPPFSRMPADYTSSNWVAGRLTELLPFALGDKQRLLEMDAAQERLDVIYGELLAEELSHHR
jgi:hypothetical protein